MEGIGSLLTDQGLLGIACAALVGAVAALWRRYNSVQDARLQDLKEGNAAVSDLARETNRALDALKTVVEGMRRD